MANVPLMQNRCPSEGLVSSKEGVVMAEHAESVNSASTVAVKYVDEKILCFIAKSPEGK